MSQSSTIYSFPPETDCNRTFDKKKKKKKNIKTLLSDNVHNLTGGLCFTHKPGLSYRNQTAGREIKSCKSKQMFFFLSQCHINLLILRLSPSVHQWSLSRVKSWPKLIWFKIPDQTCVINMIIKMQQRTYCKRYP